MNADAIAALSDAFNETWARVLPYVSGGGELATRAHALRDQFAAAVAAGDLDGASIALTSLQDFADSLTRQPGRVSGIVTTDGATFTQHAPDGGGGGLLIVAIAVAIYFAVRG